MKNMSNHQNSERPPPEGFAEGPKRKSVLENLTTDLIESFSKVADDSTPYETFIRQWNGTVKLYQDMLDRKGGSTTDNGGNTGDTGDPGNSGDSGDSGDSGTLVDGVDEG